MGDAEQAQSGTLDVSRLDSEVRPLGRDLGRAMVALIETIPGGSKRPTLLARRTGMNRVIASKLLSAISRDDPYEVLQQIPGPDSLRVVTRAAAMLGVPDAQVDDANETIDRFSSLIRRFGTRSALNAAISPHSDGLQRHFEHAGRYSIYQGMRRILGVEADTWLTSMLFVPSPDDQRSLDITTIHGAVGMRRLRPDVSVYFTFGPPYATRDDAPDLAREPFGLEEFYTHAPANLESRQTGSQLVHMLASDTLGRRAKVDMLAVSHNRHGSGRYRDPDRPRRGVAVFADVPVKTLLCDALVHESVFPDSTPELIVYNPGARGPANPNDPNRDIDRVDVPEQIEAVGKVPERFDVPEVARYDEMIERVCTRIGHDPREFRVFRLRMAYPVHGFQFVVAFNAPPAPGQPGP